MEVHCNMGGVPVDPTSLWVDLTRFDQPFVRFPKKLTKISLFMNT